MKPERITAAELHKVAAPHCDKCGSDDVRADGLNHWNAQKQNWEIVEVYEDACVCCRCGRDVQIRWRLS
jgi:hypothetical protein